MTTIAWDGKTLAADKQSTSDGLKRITTKIHRVRDGLVAITGNGAHGYALLGWFNSERDIAAWPKHSDENTCGNIIHITSAGIFVYNGAGYPHGEPIENKFIAFGHGRDYAMAAMHMGADAKKALEIASIYDAYTGMGVDTLDL